MRLRTYELYQWGPAHPIVTAAKYRSGMWIARVRAGSIKSAYALLRRQIVATAPPATGIVALDNSNGPSAGRPYNIPMRFYPPWWGYYPSTPLL